MLRDRPPWRNWSHPILHKVVSCKYSCTVHFDHTPSSAHALHRYRGCRIQELQRLRSGPPFEKKTVACLKIIRRVPCECLKTGLEKQDVVETPDVCVDKKLCCFRVSKSATWREGIIPD